MCWQLRNATLAQLAIRSKPAPKIEFRCALGQLRDWNGFDLALRERLTETSQVRFQSPNHDWFEVFWSNLYASRELLRVEHFEQRGKTVGVAVVRRGG